MKKKLVAFMLATSMALSVCSCGSSGSEKSATEEKKEDEKQKKQEEEKKEAEEQKKKEEEKKTLESYSGKPVSEFMAKVTEIGYEASYSDDGVDFTDMIANLQADYSVDSVEVDSESKKVSVDLITNTELQNEKVKQALEEKLPASNCWVAAENYGESQYPYGFELHYFMGKIAEEPEDENTWFLKAECTVTNMFGAELEGTCEAKVTGTQESPEIVYFQVY